MKAVQKNLDLKYIIFQTFALAYLALCRGSVVSAIIHFEAFFVILLFKNKRLFWPTAIFFY